MGGMGKSRLLAIALSASAVLMSLGAIGAGTSSAAACTLSGTGTSVTRTLAGRSYLLHVPANLTGASVPLLLGLHGYGEPTTLEESQSGWSTYADAHDFIVAYPAGLARFPYIPSWDWAKDSIDVAFLRSVVADIAATYCVDPARVHASGISNGALMALRLACDAPDLFASIHAHAGGDPIIPSPTAWTGSACTPSRPIGLAITQAIADPLSPYPAGLLTRNNWLARDGCPSTGTSEPGVLIEAITYKPCAAGVEVLWRVYPQSHHWPVNQPLANDADDLHDRVWGLFTRNPRP
ncbi:MAG: polyhydroxybutyrate depolymerase [Actinomycetota bacterium]|jgi:polyhydroxybutyrate depolymerase